MSQLTQPQRDMLGILASGSAGKGMTGDDLARLLYRNHRTTQGAHQTAASLVRKGLATKEGSPVTYFITATGREEESNS